MNIFNRKKSIAELEEEREHEDAEVSLLQKKVLKKELEARGASIEAFREGGKSGGVNWRRIINWLKTH